MDTKIVNKIFVNKLAFPNQGQGSLRHPNIVYSRAKNQREPKGCLK